MGQIRLLPSHLVNQIAAGEVVERPASVVKELVENSLDAGASHIEITLRDGGATYLSVADNGKGMNPQNLRLCIERHATSKLPTEDLFNIETLGFRGEALPSIGAISRLTIQSRSRNSEEGYKLSVEGGVAGDITPVPMSEGTKIEVKDLFYAIPARLKFLRSPTTEQGYIVEVLRRLSMAYPTVSFTLKTDQRTLLQYGPQSLEIEGQLKRISDIMGEEFFHNSLPVTAEREDLSLTGFIGLPTLNRSNAHYQFLFVNGRPVKDKLLMGGVRAAYEDFLAHNRYPLVSLFLTVPPREVDVNVHPAKIEVRFKDTTLVRSLLVGGIKQTLSQMAYRASNTVTEKTLEKFSPAFSQPLIPQGYKPPSFSAPVFSKSTPRQLPLRGPEHLSAQDPAEIYFTPTMRPHQAEIHEEADSHPLGAACAQLHETYIISQTPEGIVITDQHAAHERIVYEKLKADIKNAGSKSQLLLIPEVIKLSSAEFKGLMEYADSLQALGLVFEVFGEESVLVREVPAILGKSDIKKLIKDLAEEIAEESIPSSLEERMHEICSLMACHGSIRSGHRMTAAEMNDLLRQMEKTPYSGQCNHGRPTHIVLKLKDIEKLFERR